MDLSKSTQIFYKNVIEFSWDEELDDDSELMMAMAMLLNEHNSRHLHRGSVKGRATNVKRNCEKGHHQLYQDYFHFTKPIYDAETF
jgi:hypothetical protein